MLFVTDFGAPAYKAVIDTFCLATERNAKERALRFDPNAIVRFGAIKQRGNAAAFNIEGMSNEQPLKLTAIIPAGTPEGDCWSFWVTSFERAGLVVVPDMAREEMFA